MSATFRRGEKSLLSSERSEEKFPDPGRKEDGIRESGKDGAGEKKIKTSESLKARNHCS